MMNKLSLFFKNFSRNKKTNSALIGVGAIFLTAIDYLLMRFGITNEAIVGLISGNPDVFAELIAAEVVALSAVLSMAIKGKGFESEEEAQVRTEAKVSLKDKAKADLAAAKAVGNQERVARKIIKTAEGFGVNPLVYAKNMQVLPEIIAVITKLINK